MRRLCESLVQLFVNAGRDMEDSSTQADSDASIHQRAETGDDVGETHTAPAPPVETTHRLLENVDGAHRQSFLCKLLRTDGKEKQSPYS